MIWFNQLISLQEQWRLQQPCHFLIDSILEIIHLFTSIDVQNIRNRGVFKKFFDSSLLFVMRPHVLPLFRLNAGIGVDRSSYAIFERWFYLSEWNGVINTTCTWRCLWLALLILFRSNGRLTDWITLHNSYKITGPDRISWNKPGCRRLCV